MSYAIWVLFGSFVIFMAMGVPIAFAIGSAATLTFLLFMGVEQSVFIVAQQMASGLDSFTLLAIPFFILAGNIMNHGGIAMRLINFAKVLAGRLPGALAHCNVLANMMFPIREEIAYISTFTTLMPGDVIITGTPTGAGARFDPPKYLVPGDVVEVEVNGIGTLTNIVADE